MLAIITENGGPIPAGTLLHVFQHQADPDTMFHVQYNGMLEELKTGFALVPFVTLATFGTTGEAFASLKVLQEYPELRFGQPLIISGVGEFGMRGGKRITLTGAETLVLSEYHATVMHGDAQVEVIPYGGYIRFTIE